MLGTMSSSAISATSLGFRVRALASFSSKDVFQMRTVQLVKTFLYLGGGKFFSTNAEGGAGAA